MANGEELDEDGEDLVLYFNLGGHHVPSSQDVPNTLMHTSASSVMFMPFNYFDGDVSRAVRQGVRIDRRPEAKNVKALSKGAGEEGKENGKEEIRRSSHHHYTRTKAGDPDHADRQKEKHDDEITYFGAHYTKPVLVTEEMLSPDLSHYMKERDDGEDRGWKTVRNAVGGGLYGLFVGKERREGEEGGRMDW
jgi:primary-amine oxidase